EQSDDEESHDQSTGEQSKDEQSDEEQSDEEQSDEEQSDVPASDAERFEQLDQRIESARKTAEDADVLIDPDEPRYVESGETEDADDQTITPPA
ncbi:MAG: hypothetical protein KY441_07945, partial [Actinobacteria bacterium]|nr:hypothetical protein [Actinomycetota bacterium]